MFEYEGSEYTLEEVTKAAEDKKLSVEDYVSKFNLKEIKTEQPVGKPNDVVVEDATVTSVPEQASESMELEPVNYFLAPPSQILEKGKFVSTPEGAVYAEKGEAILAQPEEGAFAPIALEEVVITADQYKEREQQEENEAARNLIELTTGIPQLTEEEVLKRKEKEGELTSITEFEEAQRISSGEIAAREKRQEELLKKDLGFKESVFNSLTNGLGQVAGVDDRAKWLVNYIGSQEDLVRNIFPEETANKILKSSSKGLGEATLEIDRLNSYSAPVQQFTDIKIEEGLVPAATKGIAGVIDGITSFGASALTASTTFGTGLASDMISASIKDFNETKAESLGINVDELIKSGESNFLTPAALGSFAYSLERLGIKGVNNYIRGLSNPGAKGLFNLINVGTKEGGTELAQLGIETYNTALASGEKNPEAVAMDAMFSKEGLEVLLKGAAGGKGVALGGSSLRAMTAIRSTGENKRIADNIRKLNDLENSKFRKNLSESEIGIINQQQEQIRKDLSVILDKSENIVTSLTEDQINSINNNFDFLTSSSSEIQAINNSKKYTDQDKKVLIEGIEQQRKIASQEIYNIRNEAEKLQGEISKVKKVSKLVKGVSVQDFANASEINSFLKEKGLDKDFDTKASEQQGFIIQNPETGEQTIVINRDVASKEKAMNVAGHELGHAILFKTVKDSPETAINLGNALLNELDKIDADQIKDSKFKKRMDLYKDQKVEVQMEEALTLFSDALATGDIKFNENVFTKIGDQIRRVMQRFGVKVKFNTGRDVYNFIKDYNKSLEKGDLSLSQVEAAAKGIKGTLVKDAVKEAEAVVKESKKTPKGQEFVSLVDEGILTNESLVDVVKSPSSTQEDKFGAIEAVVEKNWPVISKAVKFNPTGSIPMDAVKEAVTEQIQGIFPGRGTALFDTYNPETSQVNTFIGSTLGPRQAEILERAQTIGGRTQAADITEARGIAAEETKTQEPTTTRSQIDVRKFGPAKDKVNEISKIVKVKEGKAPSYKDLTNEFLDEVSMEVFNVPGKKMAGRATLTDAEAKSLQRLFVSPDNVRKLVKTMPPYNVATSETTIGPQAEIIDVSRDIKGKSIGLSNKFIEKYYQPVNRAIPGISNPKGRSLGTTSQTQVYELKPEYTGRITNEIVQQIQNDVGVTERGIPNEKISAENRSKYGTTLTGFAKTYIANAINVSARAKQTSKQEQADTGAGKARLMFSKRANRFEVSGKNGIVIMRDNAEQFEKANKIDIEFEGETINVKNLDAKNPKHRAYVQQAVENELWKYFPIESLDGSTVVDYSSKQDRGFFFTKEEWADVSNKAKENKSKWLARGNKLKFDDKAIKVAKGVKAPPKKEDYYSSEKFKTKLQDWKKGVETILQGGAKAIEANNELYLPIFAIFSTQSQSSSHLARNMSVERGASKDFINATKGTKTVKEHVEPSNEMTPLMYEAMLYNEVDVLMPVIEKVYYQLGITKLQDDKTLDPSGIYGKPYNYKTTQTNEFNEGLREYFKTGDISKIISPLIRYFNPQVNNNTSGDGIPGFNSNELILEGKTVAEIYTKQLNKQEQNPDNLLKQNELTYQVLSGKITQQEAVNVLDEFIKLKSIPKASVGNNNENSVIKFSKQVPNQEVLDNLSNADQAMANARKADAPVKKIRVFDFDDTLARSNSQVLYEMPNGTTGKLNATQFAERAGELEAQGAEFDFSEFSKVVDGKRGPVFKAIENIISKRGAEDVFILTARPANAAGPIKEFMDALGVNLPIENIVGLGDGKAEAKARWMTAKAAEGYNDFFFVDDAYKNLKAVQDALNVFDVKSKVQQAKVKFSKASELDKSFNDILENKTGIASEKTYGKVKAEVAGAGKGRFNFFIPPSAEDFVGLLYSTLGKGKLGDSQMAWYKTHLLNPYARAMNELSSARIALMNDYKQLKKQLKVVPKDLLKKVPGEPYTREQAVRVYIWNTQGMDVPGISKADLKDLTDYVSDNADLQVFADQLIAMQKGDQYAKPKEGWPAGTITTDLLEGLNTTKRTKYLEQWQSNVDVIFSEKNLNKLQAAYGKDYRKALENMLQRMKTGRNRNFSGDTLTGKFTDWITGSIGTIMFFNTRSAVLQTISAVNFVNFTDNNILAAGKAFGNQKQFWSDFLTLANSDFLKERRSGLRMNVNEADIAEMAKKGGVQGVINKLLEFGFTPTQLADSFAIASGGATFYRNRIKTYEKQGLDSKEAQDKAFVDFREIAEESQQSSRPDRISMQQAGSLGRLVLAFANTPAQYARLIKKATRDLKNGRGDAKTNMSKIIYYGVAQNLLFNALQQALFAFAFGDTEPEDEEKEKKYIGIANGMMDSLLRGMGLGGAVVSVGKNALKRIYDEMQKKQPKLEKVGYELTKLSPPISAKLSRINQAARSYQWDKKEMAEKGWSLDNPAYLASANVVSALTNIPLDRAVKKTNNVVQATSQDLETWERMALLGGWSDWEIGIKEENETTKPQPRKIKRRKIKKKIIK